jgi:hypothetical protein
MTRQRSAVPTPAPSPARRLVLALLVLLAIAGAARWSVPAVVAQVVIPPTVLTVEAPTDVPPPTAPPPTDAPVPLPVAPTAPPGREHERQTVPEGPAPPTAPPAETIGPLPTRTRRPTRTPRTTATPTSIPLAAGVLRLTLWSDPAMPVPGQRVSLIAALLNRGDATASDLTLQMVLPTDVIINQVDTSAGQTARSGRLVRWYIPALAASQEATLELVGVLARAPADGVRLCVTVLSAGAPAEQCALFEPAASGPAAPVTAAAGEVTADDAPVAPADEGTNARAIGLALFLFSLAALGVMLGQRLRG